MAPSADYLAATDKATEEEIHFTPYLLTFIASWQQGTPGTLLLEVLYPTAALLK